MLKGTVHSLNRGRPKVIAGTGDKAVESAIEKKPTEDKVYLEKETLQGDEVADKIHHGGPDQAVCVYPMEHFAYWEKKTGKPFKPGAFGENVTVTGLLEEDVCIGDTFLWGEAVVQVSQPRHPCYKLAKRHDITKLPLFVQESGYSGYYFRVLKEGYVSKNDELIFKERYTDTSIRIVNRLNFQEADNREGLEQLAALPHLSEGWRENVQKKLAKLS
ncbi:MOSC domain-containing protein [Alteribacter natronophilus]|uniref:MOSC domain-containing protein n=1 Tax=Alteribacter natronophilus TaxID=2583810 RepID=UPI001FEABED4|nr:MOSC domain-containing protein [Alteribacter natronophilus]